LLAPEERLQAVGQARRRVAALLTAVVVVLYFGFIALIAWNKPLLAIELVPGLTLGILLGAVVIVSCWMLTWVYIRWADRHYDPELDAIRLELR
jgi:uncharacterized membrane protein (DUF485 family)